MNWIKVEVGIATKPEVMLGALHCNADVTTFVGACVRLWCWVDSNFRSGSLGEFTSDQIDSLVELPGFAAAMLRVKWLAKKGKNLVIPSFERHNGGGAKKRAEVAGRVEKHRKKRNAKSVTSVTQVKRKCNAKSVTKALPEQNRIEQKKETSTRPCGWDYLGEDAASRVPVMFDDLEAAGIPETFARGIMAQLVKSDGRDERGERIADVAAYIRSAHKQWTKEQSARSVTGRAKSSERMTATRGGTRDPAARSESHQDGRESGGKVRTAGREKTGK